MLVYMCNIHLYILLLESQTDLCDMMPSQRSSIFKVYTLIVQTIKNLVAFEVEVSDTCEYKACYCN